ncbi:MAG: hypothetical protein JXR36_17345 [Bacteroidales bacterium]|nr:hypothetical protein [Bacteroidales bacterium]
MKKSLISILIVVVFAASSFAANKSETSSPKMESQNVSVQFLPYANNGAVLMEKVISKGEYTLWKCPDQYVTNFPGQSITGKNFHYFVYKNNNFHMTVNENNKNDIYKFLTQ